MNGGLVYQGEVDREPSWSMPLIALPPGTYIINIFDNDTFPFKKLAGGQLILTKTSTSPIVVSTAVKNAVISDIDHLRAVLTSGDATQVRQVLQALSAGLPPAFVSNLLDSSDADLLQLATGQAALLPTDADLNAPGVLWSETSDTKVVVLAYTPGSWVEWIFKLTDSHWYPNGKLSKGKI